MCNERPPLDLRPAELRDRDSVAAIGDRDCSGKDLSFELCSFLNYASIVLKSLALSQQQNGDDPA